MYHSNNPHVIEPDDITALEHLSVDNETDPPTATIVARLHNRKPFVPKSLYLTNGVEHRLLSVPQKEEGEEETGKKKGGRAKA